MPAFSLQRILGDDDKFCALLEESAQEANKSVEALRAILLRPDVIPDLEPFATTRRRIKQLTQKIVDLLLNSYVTAMDREDIEALANAIYRIPKTVEKFAERYLIVPDQVRGVDFSRQVNLMARSVQTVVEMLREFRRGADLSVMQQLNANIQKMESDADDLILELVGKIYQPEFPPLKRIIVKDLYELNEKVVDRCRDAGNVITRVSLKNS
jgi:uncharacterized protein Yka (UPF0111/DUF47 family)